MNVAEHFRKISEDYPRLPKTYEVDAKIIKSVELNWVKRRISHEPNWLNWVRL